MLEDKKNGYLIINTGTPDEPSIPALKRYLKESLKLIPSLNDDEEWVRTFADYLFEKEEQAKVSS